MSFEELKTAALSLPREQRAQLAEDLIRSLDENHEEADAAWANDVARRRMPSEPEPSPRR